MDDKGILRGCKQFCETGNVEVLSYTILESETKTENKPLFYSVISIILLLLLFCNICFISCWVPR